MTAASGDSGLHGGKGASNNPARLAATAAAAGVVPSVVTKKLAALEARLGFKLFQGEPWKLKAAATASAPRGSRPPQRGRCR